MAAIALYLLKMLVCSGILCGYYYASLQNKLFHQWNRFYLLLTVIFSITFPALHIPLFDFSKTSNAAAQIVYKVSASELLLLKGKTQSLSYFELIIYGVYGLVVLVFLLLLLVSLYRIYLLKKRSAFIQQSEINIYQTSSPQAPFSFFRNIFWKQAIDLQSTEGQQILKHELVHVHEKHSIDKVFMQFVLGIFWINPFFWLIKKELTIIHEFIADKKSVENNDASVLASLILTTAYSSGRFDITNHFFQSSIKRRITMITKNKNPKFSYMRRIAALFVLLATLGMIAFRSKNVKEEMVVQHVQMDTVPKADATKLLHAIERDEIDTTKMTFKLNGHEIFASSLAKIPSNTVAIIIRSDVSGTVYPKTNKKGPVMDIITTDKVSGPNHPGPGTPLYIIDGSEVTKKAVDALNPIEIDSVYIWKDARAIQKFGEKGISGAVIVKTKKNI